MSPLELSCPSCRAALRVRGARPGQRVRCTRCNEVFSPPAPAEEAVPTAQPVEPAAEAPPAPIPVAPAAMPVAPPALAEQKPAPGEPGNPLPLDGPPPKRQPKIVPRKSDAGDSKPRRPQRRRPEGWDDEKRRAAPGIHPLWIVGGLSLAAVVFLAVAGIGVASYLNGKKEQAAAEREDQDRAREMREREQQAREARDREWREREAAERRAALANKIDPPNEPPVKPNPPQLPPEFPPFRPPVQPPVFPPPFVPPDRPPVEPKDDPKPEPKLPLIRAAANPTRITPTKAADKAQVKLPGTVDYTCFGGGGRFVLLRIPSAKQVAVLDVSEGKVVKYLPIPEDGALIAAGNEHLFVLAPVANVIQRWSLTTFQKEATAENPLKGTPRKLLMGHAVDGPLFVVGPNAALDTKTFRQLPLINAQRAGWGMAGHPSYPPTVNISADGRVFAWHTQGLSPSGLSSMVLGNTEDGTKTYSEHDTYGVILPGPDGTLFTGGGLFTPELKPIGERQRYQYWHHAPIPAAHGKFYVHLPPDNSFGRDRKSQKVELRMVGENKSLLDLSGYAGLDVPKDHNQTMAKGMQLYNRVFLVPDAEALAVLNGTADAVTIHRLKIDEAMAKAGVDYLYVSDHTPKAVCGKEYRYKPTVKSRQGGAKVKLEVGPDGMELETDGTLVWKVPENFADTSVTVRLLLSDKSGQEAFHVFTLPVASRP